MAAAFDPNPFDVHMREAVFFEGVKTWAVEESNGIGPELVAIVAAILAAKGIETFVGMTKTELVSIVREATKRLSKRLDRFTADTEKLIVSVTDAIITVTKSNMEFLTRKTAKIKDTASTLWQKIGREIIPAFGRQPGEVLATLSATALGDFVAAIRRAFAMGMTTADLLRRLRGTPSNDFRDGIVRTLGNRIAHIMRTVLQFAHSFVAQTIGHLFYDRYLWVSLMDDRTTPECRHNHLKTFPYGLGPIPPIHPNCRSHIVGIDTRNKFPPPKDFDAWRRDQPESIKSMLVRPYPAMKPEKYIEHLKEMQLTLDRSPYNA